MQPIKLSSLKAKPTLVEKLVEDKEVIDAFGGPLQFWTWDRLPLDVYMTLADADTNDIRSRFEVAKDLILDEDGKKMLSGDEVFTPAVMTLVVGEIFNDMGKLSVAAPTGKATK